MCFFLVVYGSTCDLNLANLKKAENEIDCCTTNLVQLNSWFDPWKPLWTFPDIHSNRSLHVCKAVHLGSCD